MHITVVKKDNGALKYSLKEETRVEGPWQFGAVPVARGEKRDWDLVWDLAK